MAGLDASLGYHGVETEVAGRTAMEWDDFIDCLSERQRMTFLAAIARGAQEAPPYLGELDLEDPFQAGLALGRFYRNHRPVQEAGRNRKVLRFNKR
jgi:hypothetical protein